MQISSLTVDYMQSLCDPDVRARNTLRRLFATTYAEFLDVLYDDLAVALKLLDDSANNYPENEPEDATTNRLSFILSGMDYSASHNKQAGGNVDLTVEVTRRNFSWIGEAKRFEGVGDMREGYLQLATRYRASMDSEGVLHGGLIGYIRKPNASDLMNSWQAHFVAMPEAGGPSIVPCTRRKNLGFVSEHKHQDYGLPLRVWHMCAVMRVAPQDRSARGAKKHQKNLQNAPKPAAKKRAAKKAPSN